MAINLINKIKVFAKTHFKYESKFNKKTSEAIKFLEEQLNKIHLVECSFNSNHGINMKFTLNVNKLDLSKKHPDELCFYDKNRNYLMGYNKKRNDFWMSYLNICSKLKEDFGLNDQEIRELTKPILETHFKCKINEIY